MCPFSAGGVFFCFSNGRPQNSEFPPFLPAQINGRRGLMVSQTNNGDVVWLMLMMVDTVQHDVKDSQPPLFDTSREESTLRGKIKSLIIPTCA